MNSIRLVMHHLARLASNDCVSLSAPEINKIRPDLNINSLTWLLVPELA